MDDDGSVGGGGVVNVDYDFCSDGGAYHFAEGGGGLAVGVAEDGYAPVSFVDEFYFSLYAARDVRVEY